MLLLQNYESVTFTQSTAFFLFSVQPGAHRLQIRLVEGGKWFVLEAQLLQIDIA
jgi:hypothetical protein